MGSARVKGQRDDHRVKSGGLKCPQQIACGEGGCIFVFSSQSIRFKTIWSIGHKITRNSFSIKQLTSFIEIQPVTTGKQPMSFDILCNVYYEVL